MVVVVRCALSSPSIPLSKLSSLPSLPMTSRSTTRPNGSTSSPTDPLTSSDWLTLHEQTDAALSSAELDLTEQVITQRQRRVLTKRIADAHTDIERLDRALTAFAANPGRAKIGEGEIVRRRGLVAALRAYHERLDASLQPAGAGGRRRGTVRTTPVEDSEETASLSNAALYAQQRQVIAAQDEKLDDILASVQTLKAISSDIHSELDLHSTLLNDVEAGVDHTDHMIKANTKKIGLIEKRDKGWLSVLCMLLWIVLIIILLATDAFCPLFALMGSHCDGHNESTPPKHNTTQLLT